MGYQIVYGEYVDRMSTGEQYEFYVHDPDLWGRIQIAEGLFWKSDDGKMRYEISYCSAESSLTSVKEFIEACLDSVAEKMQYWERHRP